ncbi:Annexin 5 isoform 2 [Hibiscus syriacus]|uniref:Annexin 5 isoform 2 n=1 Tax=Hibiscus syriacus TaxID=106335 RepID=A0A6A2ZSM9_HIBSY|nr:Annexin 5 isoform 2 [Hibiscus syriacus]
MRYCNGRQHSFPPWCTTPFFIQHEYKAMYSEDLLKRLVSELSGKLEDLFKAGEKKLGTDEKTFIRIFSERSRAQLAAITSAYHDMYGGSLKKAVKSETSGKLSMVLHDAREGLGTDDTAVIRVIVTRTEIDMHYKKLSI